jgi:hypothetical protein
MLVERPRVPRHGGCLRRPVPAITGYRTAFAVHYTLAKSLSASVVVAARPEGCPMKNIRVMSLIVCLGLWLAWPAAQAANAGGATEKRCGWLENPTPGNWWLRDRDEEWTLGVQGGYQARGLDNMPDMTTKGWVATNAGGHGYGCACMDVQVDRKSGNVLRLVSAQPLPIGRCKADPKLPAPE